MSDDYKPNNGDVCLYKTRGGVNWCLCRIIAFYNDKVWVHNLSVGSMPVIREHSAMFTPLDVETAKLVSKGVSNVIS